MTRSTHILREAAQTAAASASVHHPLNERARRKTVSLGDATGLSLIGVHINVIAPGDSSTEVHAHACADEFVYILGGQGIVTLDEESYEIGAGDFIGFPANGPAHALTNTGVDELVYLVGGNRPDFDACDYPRQGKRLYLVKRADGRHLDLVDVDAISPLRK